MTATLPNPAAPGAGRAAPRLLVSVKSVDEARLVARSGAADFIDLKEPGQGALGGLPVATIRAIVGTLRAVGCALPVSATIGDWPAHRLDDILAAVDAVGACGVDYVKVGIASGGVRASAPTQPAGGAGEGAAAARCAGPAAGGDAAAGRLAAAERPAVHGAAVHGAAGDPAVTRLLDALAASRWPVVPVFIGDDGIDTAAVAVACRLRGQRGAGCFPALMVDTAAKQGGSLFARVPAAAARRFVADVRQAGALAGLSGALRLADLPVLAALSPDFAGFRSAVCAGDRAGDLDAALLVALAERLRGVPPRP